MNLNKDPESWARVSPDAVAAGGGAQVCNVLEMALQDIQRQADEIERIKRSAHRFIDEIAEKDTLLIAKTAINAEMLAALKAARTELYWCAKQLELWGLKGLPGDSVDRALRDADAAIACAAASDRKAEGGNQS